MKKHAVALCDFGLAGARLVEGTILRDLPADQFADLVAIDFVREATAEDLGAAPVAIAVAPAPKPRRRPRKAPAPKPVPQEIN